MKKIATCLFLALSAYCGAAQTGTPSCSDMTLGTNGSLNGFVPSPNDAWHQDISNLPVDVNSNAFMAISPNGFRNVYLHPDLGSTFGIPYSVVDSSATPPVPVKMVMYIPDSDQTLYPFTPNQSVEDGMTACPFDIIKGDGSDHHVIAIDKATCTSNELWVGSYCGGQWSAANGAIWDLTKTEQRPYGMTSVDAAGLSVFSGLIRYDEIVAGAINHAIRFTAAHTENNQNGGCFTAPATHAAGTNWNSGNGVCMDNAPNLNPVIGMRLRLRADFDISGFSQTNQIILKAMKQYGMILADNGGTMYFQGTADPRWNDNDLNGLKAVPSSAFEVVQMNPVYDANSAPQGPAPQINSFTASPATVNVGESVTLSSSITGDSYDFIDLVGLVRGPVTVTPTATTTYTLTSRNAFGTSTSQVTVTVNTAPPPPVVQSVAIANPSKTFNVYVFTAQAQLSNNTTEDVTRSATWTSSNPNVATISNGTLLFTRPGITTVTAQAGAKTSQPITVRAIIPSKIHSNE